DLFDKYNCKITFFIQSAWDPQLLEHFCTEALKRGHDIGFHTINHLDLRKVSMDVFLAETVEPVELYRQAGIPVTAFAFPFGFSEPWMYDILWPSFDVLRGYGTTYRLYSDEKVRAGFLISKAIDNTVIKGDENFQKTITSMLRTVKFLNDGQILPVTTHDISDDAAWGISAARLEFFIKTASDLGLKFYRYSDFSKNH
ncbi:MAG: polysaccharide deacetylase family protein, partial [Treponema sp.]|nr:polysaccharide deacetylase family protein [Treponema sp.]